MRIDKWLWAARFFKTRTLASQACDLRRVQINTVEAKPARELRMGDTVTVSTPGGDYTVKVLQLSENRSGAEIAKTLYEETEASRILRAKSAEERKAAAVFEPARKPNKRDRRMIHSFRGDF